MIDLLPENSLLPPYYIIGTIHNHSSSVFPNLKFYNKCKQLFIILQIKFREQNRDASCAQSRMNWRNTRLRYIIYHMTRNGFRCPTSIDYVNDI